MVGVSGLLKGVLQMSLVVLLMNEKQPSPPSDCCCISGVSMGCLPILLSKGKPQSVCLFLTSIVFISSGEKHLMTLTHVLAFGGSRHCPSTCQMSRCSLFSRR